MPVFWRDLALSWLRSKRRFGMRMPRSPKSVRSHQIDEVPVRGSRRRYAGHRRRPRLAAPASSPPATTPRRGYLAKCGGGDARKIATALPRSDGKCDGAQCVASVTMHPYYAAVRPSGIFGRLSLTSQGTSSDVQICTTGRTLGSPSRVATRRTHSSCPVRVATICEPHWLQK